MHNRRNVPQAWNKAALFAVVSMVVLALAAASGEAAAEIGPQSDRFGDPLPTGAIARLGTVRLRGVRGCLAFSPDGKLLVSATGETGNSVTFWEVATGREVRRIKELGTLSRLAFSPDGKRLACSTNRCQVFEAASGKELFAVKGVRGDFSADGKMLVTADATDSRGYVWDAATGRQLRHWSGAKGRKGYEGLLLAVGGQTAAILDWTRRTEAEICDIGTGKKIRSLHRIGGGNPNPGIPDGWRSLALSRDGKTLVAVNNTAATNNTAVQLLDVESGKTVASWRGRALSDCVFSPDGKRLAWTGYGEQGGGIRLWVGERTADGGMRVIGEPVSTYGMVSPSFSADGERLALVTDAAAVSFHEAATGKKVRGLDAHDGPVTFLTFTPDGRHVISRAGADIFAWDTRSGRLLRRGPGLLVGREFIERVLPDGRLATIDPDRDLVRLRDMVAGRVDQQIEAARPDFGPPVSVPAPAGRHIAIHRRDGSVGVFDLRTGQCKYRLDARQARQGMQLSDDGDILVWCNGADGKAWHSDRDGKINVHVRSQASGKTLALRDLPKSDICRGTFDRQPCVSPDGRWLVLDSEAGRLRRWDLTTGRELSPLTEAFWNAWDFSWSPDSRIFAAHGTTVRPNGSWGLPSERRLWDVATGGRLALLKTSTLVRFSPDSRTMLTADAQGIIHLWEAATGKERGHLRGHLASSVGALAVSADGRMLVSGGQDSQVLVWDLTGRMPDGQWHPARQRPERLRAAWETLAGADGRAAYAALWQMAADPERSVALLSQQLRPVTPPKQGQIARLIVALESEDFAERESAGRELERLGELAAAELRQTLTRKPSLEVRRHVEALLECLATPPAGERLRVLRSLEVLEQIGTKGARDVLRKLTEGAPEARATQEARATLGRSERKNGETP